MDYNIQDIYSLSPMQQGMLFHSLMDNKKTAYLEQLSCEINGNFDTDLFKRSWEVVIDRHSILRTAFVWEDVEKPLQVVMQSAPLAFQVLNWREYKDEEIKEKYEKFLHDDLEKGFDFSEAPLMRITIISIKEDKLIFVWTHHHILFDGWGMQIILRDVFEVYESLINDRQFNLKLTRPYKDYIQWLEAQDINQAEDFWKRKLGDFYQPSLLSSSANRLDSDDNSLSVSYAYQKRTLGLELTKALNHFSKHYQLTLNTIIQGAWAMLIHFFSLEDDVAFGVTVSGRPLDLPGSEEIAGLFINTLPLRIKFDKNTTVLEWLKSIQLEQAQMLQYDYAPLFEIQKWSGIEKGSQLFDSILVFENYPVDKSLKEKNTAVQISKVESYSETNYPLTFVVYPGNELSFEIAYNSLLFSQSKIQYFLDHLTNILKQFVSDPGRLILQSDILSEDQRNMILYEWNKSEAPIPEEQLIHSWFEKCAKDYGALTALKYNGSIMTYSELNEKANQLAHYLINYGAKAEVIVGISVERSFEMIISILGVLKSGAAYLPLDPSYPGDRLNYMIKDSGCKILITKEKYSSVFTESVDTIYLDSTWQDIETESKENPSVKVLNQNLAYVIYTSGSTGRPKGTLLEHKGFCNFIKRMIDDFTVDNFSRVLQFASFSFDASVAEIFLGLLSGATLYLADREKVISVEDLSYLIKNEKISVATLPPAVLNVMENKDLDSFKSIISIGETCKWEIADKWSMNHNLFNGYGPTETTVGAAWMQVEKNNYRTHTVPVGKVIKNAKIYILDKNLNPLPAGITGQIYIGGMGVARGYLNQPALTAEKFVADPFSMLPGARLYKTSDLGCYLSDGTIEFKGRIDNQVKIRGFRIELEEIESALKALDYVKSCAVVDRQDENGNKKIVAYIILQDGIELDRVQIRNNLSGRLPDFMLPSAFVYLNELPLTHNGKLDRKALPDPEEMETIEEELLPLNETGELLANIWKSVLKVKKVSSKDNFFELGGHSLSATQLLSRIRDIFKIELPLEKIFTSRDLRQLAQEIDSRINSSENILSVIEKAPRQQQELKLSFSQQRLWFIEKLRPGGSSYNIPAAIKIKGKFSTDILKMALNDMIDRHEILRTSFMEKGGRPYLNITEKYTSEVEIIDISEIEDERMLQSKVEEIIDSLNAFSFDLSNLPLFKFAVITHNENEHFFVAVMHHIITDGWSVGIFFNELKLLYEKHQGISVKLPELPLQYSDYAQWQQKLMSDELFLKEIQYWKDQLSDIPQMLNLPVDKTRPSVQTTNGDSKTLFISESLRLKLQKLSIDRGATLFMVMLSAFKLLMHKYSGQDDIVIGSPIAGRIQTGLEGLIGFFVNNIALRCRFENIKTFYELIENTRKVTLEAYKNQHVPFERLVEELQPERDLSHLPIFQVMFVFQNLPFDVKRSYDISLEAMPIKNKTSNFDISMIITEAMGGLNVEVEYNTDLFFSSTIERMLEHYNNILETIVTGDEKYISDIDFLTKDEKDKLLFKWNQTEKSYPDKLSVHECFENLALQMPDATAVRFRKDEQSQIIELTYQQLNNKANKFAHYLKRFNLQKEDLVGIITERSVEMIVAILGVLKAEAAFVPIDPANPKDRISYIINDAAIRLLVYGGRAIDSTSIDSTSTQEIENVVSINIDYAWNEIEKESEANLNVNVDTNNLAYVIYTSGSTGKPKGTMLRHQGLCNLASSQKEIFGLEKGSRVLQFSSLSFDASVWEIVMALLSGAALSLMTKDVISSGEKLGRMLELEEISIVTLPPSVLAVIPQKQLKSLHTIVTAGEAVSKELVNRWSVNRRFFNAYGPTETTVCASIYLCENNPLHKDPPIGRPLNNFKLYVLDKYDQLCGIGIAGELCVEGAGLARGYLKRPELTAEKFIPNPFSTTKGSRLYRTGDLVKYNEDGNIEYLGRIDHQVKVRGFRIELGEIETLLHQNEKIKDVIVTAKEDNLSKKVVAAYYVLKDNEQLSSLELKSYLKKSLPEYMIPSAFICLDKMPLNISGKVDLKALPKIDLSDRQSGNEYVAPKTETEEILVSIIESMMNIPKAGILDSFFELGGHSLLATQLISRIREQMHVEIPLRVLFERPVICDLASEIDRVKEEKYGQYSIQKIERKPEGELQSYPLSFAQRRMWFLDQFEPGSPYYNIPMAIKITGTFSVEVFRKVVKEILNRHEALRTTFKEINGIPQQIISRSIDLPFTTIDLGNISAEEIDSTTARLAREEARKPFDISTGPLFRVSVLLVSETENIVLFTMHHIISDGWSMGVLTKEISFLYKAFLSNEQSPLSELEYQYVDYSYWQKGYLEGEILNKQLDYWKGQLQGKPPLLELPIDKPRPAVWTNEGTTTSVVIPKELTNSIKKLCQNENSTLFMVLISALNILLYRYCNDEDISIGTPIANRTRKEFENIIGLFINTLVIRTKLEGNPSFLDLLNRVREVTISAYENQDLPFELLVEQLQPDRNMSYPPLFQVMFILQNSPSAMEIVPGITLKELDVEMGTSTTDLTISVSENSSGLDVSVEYNTDLFFSSTIERLLSHFIQILKSISTNPLMKISDIDLFDEIENEKIVYQWNSNTSLRPKGAKIHELFEKQVLSSGNNIAVVFNDKKLTYHELNQKANKLAHRLIQLSVKPEQAVAICLDRSTDMMVAVLGVLKSGGAYLPLDSSYPEDRLSFMLEDAKVSVMITQKSLLGILPGYKGNVILIDENWSEIDSLSSENPCIEIDEKNLAYQIYTSGSTGKPKGTMIPHISLVNAALSWQESYELLSRSRNHLQMASFSFDVFSGDWTRALCSGGKLIITPREILLDAEKLYDLMLKEKVNIAEFVPAVLRNLIDYVEKTGRMLDFFNLLIAGSDIWYVGEYRKFRKFCGSNTRLVNSFGLTEATIDSSFYEDDNLSLSDERLVPIGKPFANMKLYILDKYLYPVPIGVRGELYVGGLGVARGYHNRPEVTSERFIPDPFSKTGGERLYKTGDMARFLDDGNIEFLGRIDNQVKLRGFRVELGEIESALTEIEFVKEAVVIAREDKPGNKRLAAYVVLSDKEIKQVNFKKILSDKLPDYMVPSAFVILDSMPLTPNSKVDRKALPIPEDTAGEEIKDNYVSPQNPVEEFIANIWADVLLAENPVGIFSNFFDLGGHSLLAAQVISRIRETFNVDIPLRSIFENPTVASLAKVVERSKAASSGLSIPPIMKVSRDQKLPLSFAQQRLWFLEQLEPDSPFYNIPEIYKIKGEVDFETLQKSLNYVVKRHEVLRTIFISEDGIPRQIVLPELEVKIELIDFSSYEEIQKNKAVEEILDKQAKTPIKITEAPLFRFNLIKTEKDEFIVLMIIHHIISDDWSTGIMFREISLTYESLLANSDLELEDLSVQYADYAYWQRDWLKGEILQKQLNYWKNKLEGIVPMISLPVDHARPAVQTFNGSFVTFEFSEELSQEVKSICRSEGSTLYMVLMAAFQMLLYKYSGQEDFCIGTPIANRNNTDAEKLIGFFVNTLVIRNDAENKISFSKLLKKVKETSLEAYTYQDIPFEQVVEAVQPVRDLSHSPLFQIMFVIQNAANIKRNIKTTQFQISPVEAHSGTAKFDITLFMLEDNDKIAGAFEYNRDLFERETIEKMIGHYINILKQAVSEPERQISQIGLLSKAEEEHLVKEINKAEQIDLIEGFVHQAFETVVEKMPEAVAIKTFDKEISYSALNRYSNILANRLIDKGIRPDDKVAIFLDRSAELVIGLLGILKSGGAYIPVEVSYPKERIRYILEDSKPEIILTKKKYLDILNEFSDINELNDLKESSDLKDSSDKKGSNEIKELYGSKIMYIDEEEGLNEEELNEINPKNELNPEVEIESDNLAYIIYTSGSTGKPKGVMITHCGLRSYLSWAVEAYPLKEGKGSILHSTIAFDATVTAIYPALIMGKSVMILPEGNDIELLGKALLENKDFSLVKITPAHLDILSSQLQENEIKGLTRSFVIGGENLSYSQIEKWQSNAPETLLFNEYGPTETVVGCVVFEASKALASEGSVPIGRVISNTRIYVLDEDLRPVAQGLVGELYIGGISLARGYLNKASLTAEKFIADPFSSIPGQRLYRTGDMVRVLKSGDLEFLGRTDSQVKIRGYRIELGEIENVIKETLHLKDALAIVKTESNGSKRLVAFCLKENEDENKEASIEDSALLRRLLSERLPEYMIPSRFVFLDSFPITSNGKVNRKALDELILKDEISEARVIVSPRNADEMKMQKIWKEVLSVENISIHDNFFELGGDSIVAMQVIARANQSGFDITIRDLFQNPTIEKLSLKTGSSKQVLAEQGLVTGSLPLAPIQNWFFSQRLNEPDHYNQSVMFELNSTLDIRTVHEIFNHIIEHHDALRAQFIFDGKEWKESISGLKPDSSKVIEYYDLSEETEVYSKVQIICDRLQSDLDISEAPLLRVAYFKTRDELDDLMLIVIHHLVVDAVSWRILFDDLQLSLKQYLQGENILLPHKTSSYKSWAEKLIDYSRNNEFIDEVKYWKGILSKDYPEIPRDYIEAENFESSASSLSVSLSSEITGALLSKANDAFRTDINDLLLTALTRSFSTLTGKSRLLINLEAHGRDFAFEDIDVSRTVGWFTNLYPAALDLEGVYETSEAIKTVKEQLRQIPEKGRNFGIIKYLSEDINLRKTFEDLKEPEIIFNYLGQFNSPSSAQDEKTSGSFNISSLPKGKESGDENRRQALIDINGGVYNGQLQFEWSYSNKIHNESTIKEVADLFIKELENIASYCTSAEVGSLSSSDLRKYKVDEETFKKIEKALKDNGIKGYEVEDIYPLSPMQQGMLFHSQLSTGSGTYIEQLSSFFIGKLDPQAFMKAWTSAVENHTILRTLFITRGLDEPIQVVKKSIEALPLEIIDLSENGENYDDILNEIKKSEVERGFDYLKAPLFRIKLIKLEEEKYQFIWTYHHILLDGWSVPQLLQEIFAAYESLLDKKQLPASQRSSYGEYISWLKHQDILSAEKFWRDYLSGVEEPTYLPAKKLSSGRSVKEGEIETLEMELSKELTNKLQSLLSPQSITMNSLIQCIWATILNKYSLNDDVIFGSTVSGRPSDLWGSESMLGLFINTLPVRIKFDKDLSVIDWLKSVQKDQLLMRQFEYSPLTEIQNWTSIPRTKQLFETILVYENFPVKEFLGKEKGSFQIQKVQSSEKTNYPITLVAGQSDKLMLRILYDSSLFDSSAVKRIFTQMKRLLETVANCPEKKLSELPYLPGEELNKVLKEWNDTTRPLPEFMTIHQMFENQVKKTPEAQALYFNGESLSYRQLNVRANKLANYLRQIGAKKEELVGLYIDRSSEMIIGMLAILKAGCAYLPLDPKLPVDRLQFMADESALKIILTKKTIIESKPLNNSAFICFDTDSDLIESQPGENLSIVVHPENLTYVIYTSGTTGRPKGVMVQHKGIINLALHYAEALSLGEGKKLFQFFSFSFDGSIVEIFCSLISGTTLYMPDAETAMPGPKMVKYLNENKIDKVTFSPSVLSVLPGEELNHIDAIIAGGEALSFDVVRKWFNRDGLTFINAYGPTESTVCVSCFKMTSLPDFSDIIPIGRPLPNFRLYILDKNLNPAAIGVPGEIFVGGIGLARGYLNRPDITAERFIPDPFLEGQRLYRTGDVARYREDGCIEFLGRNDDQVKLRGFRIELGEIESAALNSGTLQSASALIISENENAEDTLAFTDKISLANKDRDKQLVLFYVLKKQSYDITSAQIKDFIKKRLPEYMIPSQFIKLDALPLNNSGKIDKKALISILKQKDENSHEKRISMPQTLSEQLLLSLWKDLLKKETISTNDNFFELGGHSLIVTQLASRIIDAFGVEIALNRLFELTTIKQQASEIDLQKSESKLKEILIIQPVERTSELPLSFAQQRLWFLDQYEPESALYNLPAILRIKGSLKIDALINSIKKLVKRHEILRTVFINDNGKARQLILPECDIKLDIEVSKVEELSEEKIKEIFNDQMQKPFDLTKAPLFSIKLLEISPDDFVFILIMHHIISDGWSMGLMIREITELYNVEANSNEADVKELVDADIPQLNIQYADYAFWQRQWLSGEVLEEHKNYWNAQLLGAPEIISLPLDHPRPSVQTYNGSSFSFTIERKLAETLRKISVKENSTLFMTLLSAFNILLYRYSGQTDIVVGTPVANRNSSEVEKLIGFFVNTLALRSRINPNMTFNEVLYQLRKTTVDAYQYQNLPFEMLVDLLKPSRDLSYSPIFQVMFVFQNLPPQKKTFSDLSFYSMDFENTVAKFDLTLSISESENELLCGFEYNSDLFEKSTIEKMTGHFINLIEEISLDTEKKLYEYDILENNEKDKLAGFSGANNKVPLINPFVIKSFEEHVRTNPDSVAVKYEDQAISYGELNRRSNMLARYLTDNGVKAEVIVALMAHRSIETIVSILAILKAGGAYLPVDPLYPEGRINYILEDSKASIIITQKDLDYKLQQGNLKVIYLNNIWENVKDYPPYSLQNRVEKENLAYVIYTSGSTGNPKGVMLNHLGLANLVQAQNKIFDISSSSRLLQFASLSFDASVSEIFTSLTSGAQLLLAPKEKLTASDELIELLEEEKVSVVTLPPSLLSNLPQRKFPYLKTIISAGERCHQEISRIFSEGYNFINAYGPTEATVGSSFYLVEKSDEALASVPIGKPIENGSLYILDEYLSPMPIGLTGELYIGGIGLARGYLNKAHLTAEKFIPDPFDKSGNGERLYRTGDLARYLPDGNIEFMGRIDNQVKLRGFRIELEEIETTLLQSSQIKESAVVIDELSQNRNLIAFCILKNASKTADIALIREEIRLKLPDYMVPSNYVFLEQMPLTSNGKIDRKSLMKMKYNVESLRREYVAPETDSEKTLIGLFSQLLNKERIGIDDNFFDLGGDSILSIQLVALAAQAGIKLRPKDLFQFPTVRDLSTLCNQNIESSETIETETNTSDKESQPGDIPLTPIQHWFFEHHRLRPEHFNSSMYMELYIKLDTELLKKAVDIMISRHDSFRLSFINEDGQWKQRLLNAEIIEESKAMDGNLVRHPFRYYDLSSFSPREQKDILQEEIEKLEASFVLSEGLLFRVAYFELGKNTNPRLLFIFHHLVMDGVSWRIIVDDFLRIYSKLRTGEVPVFLKKSSSYSDWAREVKRLADSKTINKEYEYWSKLTNVTPSSLPIDFPEGISTYGSMDNITLSVPQQLTNRLLKELPLILKASVKDVLTTVLYRTISQWVKNSSIIIEMEGHGREDISDRLDLSQTVGWFTSSYPVLIKAEVNEDIFKQIANVKDILRNIPANGFGFNVLKYLSEDNLVKETMKQMPKSQINFNYLGQFDQSVSNGDGIPFKIAGELTGLEQYPKERTTSLLYLICIVNGGELHIRWLYSRDVFKHSTIKKLAKTFYNDLRVLTNRIISQNKNIAEKENAPFENDNIIEENSINK